MTRISPLPAGSADPKAAELLSAVQKQMGGVPNIVKTLAQSTAALEAYLAFSGALGGGTLGAKLQEQIALTVAGVNRCDYCASAHTALSARLGVDAEEARDNLSGLSNDPKTNAALSLASAIVHDRGEVEDAAVEAARLAGFGDGEIVEIIANVALNIFTNYLNHIARTEIDFPVVKTARI